VKLICVPGVCVRTRWKGRTGPCIRWAARAHSPGRETVPQEVMKRSAGPNPSSGETNFSELNVKPYRPHPLDEIALICDDVRLPDDGPEHQAHCDSCHAQSKSQMRFSCRYTETTNQSDHWFLLAHGRINRLRIGSCVQVASAGMIPKPPHCAETVANMGPSHYRIVAGQ
jgi:hypothetical protein